MQPDLPWNVAGIPPEAREAARAAARREGLSVGEWLTRRILKSLIESGETGSWQRDADYRADESQARDTQEMLARVSRSESETSSAYRRIEDQLRNLSRRLEETERTQSENSRAMNLAANEINIAAREQAQAFDQLGTHVVSLGDRVARVERGSAADGIKDAVKGLHAGLSRLADQIADSSNSSANQIAALAGNVESVAQRIGAVHGEAEDTAKALSARLGAFEERMRTAENAAQAIAEKLEKALEGIEAARSSERDALDKIQSRVTASEAQMAGALAHVEDQIARAETRKQDASSDRRLQSIEHALADVANRLENAERTISSSTRAIDEDLRIVSARLDAADKRHRDAFAELQAVPAPPASVPSITPSSAKQDPTPGDNPDLPPFPEKPKTSSGPQAKAISGDLRKSNEPTAAVLSNVPPTAFVSPTGDAASPSQPQPMEAADSYIAAARRSAREAVAEGRLATDSPLAAFAWSPIPAAPAEEIPPKSSASRFLVAAVIVIMATGAIVAGILLSRGLVRPPSTGFSIPVFPDHDISPPSAPAKAAATEPAESMPSPSVEASEAHAPQSLSAPPHILRRKIESTPAARSAVPSEPKPASSADNASASSAKPLSAMDRLIELATTGNADAELLVGLKYLDGDGVPVNEAEAAKWLERAADQGEAVASYRLGTLYERGHGVPANAAKAVQYYVAAAKLGNRKAMHNLAVAYAGGTGTQKDLVLAAEWFSKAAMLGLADSQFNLAVLFERGLGVQQSLIDAYKWYAIAATQGDVESQARLDAVSAQMSSDERAEAQRAASDFHPEALDRKANMPPDFSVID